MSLDVYLIMFISFILYCHVSSSEIVLFSFIPHVSILLSFPFLSSFSIYITFSFISSVSIYISLHFFLLSLSLTLLYFSHLSTFSSFRLSYMGESEVSEKGWQSEVLWSEWAVLTNARANERSERPSDPYKAPKSVCRGTPLLASFAPLSCPLD